MTWWKGLEQLNQTFEYTSSDGNVTTSVVTFTPSAADHGSNIACRATNPSMDSESAEEDNWQISVQCEFISSGVSFNNGHMHTVIWWFRDRDQFVSKLVDVNSFGGRYETDKRELRTLKGTRSIAQSFPGCRISDGKHRVGVSAFN